MKTIVSSKLLLHPSSPATQTRRQTLISDYKQIYRHTHSERHTETQTHRHRHRDRHTTHRHRETHTQRQRERGWLGAREKGERITQSQVQRPIEKYIWSLKVTKEKKYPLTSDRSQCLQQKHGYTDTKPGRSR